MREDGVGGCIYPSGSHDMVSDIFWGPSECLSLIILQEAPERLGHRSPPDCRSCSSQHGHLQQHGGDEVHRL